MFQIGGDIWRILALAPAVHAAHYSIEYRTHFTGMHMTVVGLLGATEHLITVLGTALVSTFYA